MQNKWFLSQQSKQKKNKSKSGFSPLRFVFQIIPWSWKHLTNRKVNGKKVFWQVILHSSCAMFCVSFSSKLKAINVFPKHILKSKTCDQSNRARKKLFCHVIVKNYLCDISWMFSIKTESLWRCEVKEQAPQSTLPYHGRTVRSSHWGVVWKNYS